MHAHIICGKSVTEKVVKAHLPGRLKCWSLGSSLRHLIPTQTRPRCQFRSLLHGLLRIVCSPPSPTSHPRALRLQPGKHPLKDVRLAHLHQSVDFSSPIEQFGPLPRKLQPTPRRSCLCLHPAQHLFASQTSSIAIPLLTTMYAPIPTCHILHIQNLTRCLLQQICVHCHYILYAGRAHLHQQQHLFSILTKH